MQYRGWTIEKTWLGPFHMFVAIKESMHDESGEWQLVDNNRDSLLAEIDEKEEESQK